MSIHRDDDSLDFISPENDRDWQLGGGYECTFCRKWSRKPFEAQIGGDKSIPVWDEVFFVTGIVWNYTIKDWRTICRIFRHFRV